MRTGLGAKASPKPRQRNKPTCIGASLRNKDQAFSCQKKDQTFSCQMTPLWQNCDKNNYHTLVIAVEFAFFYILDLNVLPIFELCTNVCCPLIDRLTPLFQKTH